MSFNARRRAARVTAAWVIAAGLAVAMAVCVLPAAAQEVLGSTGIKGAGSTFAYPVLSSWSRGYRTWLSRGGEFPTANAGLDDPPAETALDYEPVGSLAGILRVKDRAVDFAASEKPLTSEELATLGLCQFPIVVGGVVVVVNIEGIRNAEMKLTGPVLAEIFLGNISRWSDARILALNPSLKLPDAAIAVVRRSDGSGTTFNFTEYLSQVSPEWKLKAGAGLLISWPVGTGAKGNEGVAHTVQAVKNSIGYVDFGQARQLKMRYALIQNRAGTFVRPEPATFQAAASSADWAHTKDFYLLLTNTPGKDAYPLTATVFAVMPRAPASARNRNSNRAALDFLRWSLERGSSTAAQLGYVPLPPTLLRQVEQYLATTFKSAT